LISIPDFQWPIQKSGKLQFSADEK